MYKNMSRFKNYNWYAIPFSFNGVPVTSLTKAGKSHFQWTYKEEVELYFEIDDRYYDYPLAITVYDHSLYPVYKLYPVEISELGMASFIINKEYSENVFKPGTYYLEIQSEQKISEDTTYKTTLLPLNGCELQVV